MTRFDDPPTLATRLRAAQARRWAIAVEAIWQGGRPTSLVTTYRAPVRELDTVTRGLAAQSCNARLRLTEGEWIEWTISEPLDRAA